jgi:SET domain
MALVPLKGDLKKADRLISKFISAEKKILINVVKNSVFEDLWESFVWKNPWDDTSRVLSAIPKKWEDVRIAANYSLRSLKRKQHSVTIDWLEQNGECGDWITAGISTLSQAGHGAFGRKSFLPGDTVISLPLIHIPYREVLDMYQISSFVKKRGTRNQAIHTQILENYCMGHRESTLLLCPYGTLSSYINHNQTLANVRMEWADPRKSIQSPSWLEKSIDELSKEYRAGLSMNIIAIRDINAGEEIFLDYGDDWENAWKHHLRSWISNPMDENYKSAEQFNMEMKEVKTEKEQSIDPYPSGVKLYFFLAFARSGWLSHWENGTIAEYLATEGRSMNKYVDVEVLNRTVDTDGISWYDVLAYRSKYRRQKIKRLPRESLRFFDVAYSTDMFQPNAFRHDIGIPDSLFPDVWKNLRKPDFPEEQLKSEKMHFSKNESSFDCQEEHACMNVESNPFI